MTLEKFLQVTRKILEQFEEQWPKGYHHTKDMPREEWMSAVQYLHPDFCFPEPEPRYADPDDE